MCSLVYLLPLKQTDRYIDKSTHFRQIPECRVPVCMLERVAGGRCYELSLNLPPLSLLHTNRMIVGHEIPHRFFSISPYVCLSLHMSVCPSVCLSVCLSV